jgi:NADH dehydrogenase
VAVEPDLRIPGHANVFAIGDLSSLAGRDGKPLPGVAAAAIQQGCHAAQVIADGLAGREAKPFEYRDRGSLATIGRSSAVAVLGGVELSGPIAWLVWVVVHVAELVGFRNRLAVMYDWFWAYFRFYRSARIIFGGTDTVLESWHEIHRAADRAGDSAGSEAGRPAP